MNKKVWIVAVAAVLAMALGACAPKTDPAQTTAGSDETTGTTGPVLGENGVGEIPLETDPTDVTETSTENTQDETTAPTTDGEESPDTTLPSAGPEDETNPTQPPQEDTQPTTPPTQPSGDETEPTEPAGPTEPPVTEPPVTEPPVTEPTPVEPTEPERAPEDYTYEEYMAMTQVQQQAFFGRFDTPQEFAQWLQAAKAAYEEAQNEVEIEGGNVNIGDFMGGNGNG